MEQSCADQATTVHPINEDQAQIRNRNAQSPPVVALAASLAQQEAPSAAVTTEISVSRLTSEVVVRESSEEEGNSADEDYSPESDVSTIEKVPTMSHTPRTSGEKSMACSLPKKKFRR
ncbi:hypothetical protein PI125_g14796 [Phytophthora idaei]|nr:hypothetical protein PI125_g14796 [Phytophthora idaei]KAG3151425.1 hypothetical protein PI126_g11017 [Phytophthora idaei]